MSTVRLARASARELAFYLAFGGLQLGVDWLIFMGLTACGVMVAPANLVSRFTAAGVGYVCNSAITFRSPSRQTLDRSQITRYVLLWLVLTAVSTVTMDAIGRHGSLARSWLAKPVVEAVLACVSFVSMKLWVFRPGRR